MMAQVSLPSPRPNVQVYPIPRVNRGDKSRVLRWVVSALAVIVALGLAVTIVNIVEAGGPRSLKDAPSIGIPFTLGLVLVLAVYGILGLAPGADQVAFGSDGFEFTYRGGKTRSFHWTRGPKRLTLWTLTDPEGSSYSVSTRVPFLTPITSEVYSLIYSEAVRRGFVVEEKSQYVGGGMRQTMTRLTRRT